MKCSLVFFLFPLAVLSRVHHLTIHNDGRCFIQLSSFGFFSGGKLTVNVTGFHFEDVSSLESVVGFSIEKTGADALNPYIRAKETQCILEKVLPVNNDGGIVKMIMNFKDKMMNVKCSKNIQSIVILDSHFQGKVNESTVVKDGQDRSMESGEESGAPISKRSSDNKLGQGDEKPSEGEVKSGTRASQMNRPINKVDNSDEKMGQSDKNSLESDEKNETLISKINNQPIDVVVHGDQKLEQSNKKSLLSEEKYQPINEVGNSDKKMEQSDKKSLESKVISERRISKMNNQSINGDKLEQSDEKSLESKEKSKMNDQPIDEVVNSDENLGQSDKKSLEKDEKIKMPNSKMNNQLTNEVVNSDKKLLAGALKASNNAPVDSTMITKPTSCKDSKISLNTDAQGYFETSFVVYLSNESMEGLYSIFFHNCLNYLQNDRGKRKLVDFTIDVEEKNAASYLSAGEMPLPALYQAFSIMFFIAACFWSLVLANTATTRVFRIHWLMSALIFLKSLSLFFHGADYKEISANGIHTETWAVLYYITHLLKGGLLFFTIVLIGSGWAFVKHVLSTKEKKVFMVVLPLQVISNVAYIILEESEQGEAAHKFWKEVFVLIDLICCCAILLPVIWSIRHLQDASASDGKAAASLEKLKVFKHFYIMVVCYVYFTRIIVYMLRISLPFQYVWLESLFTELATLVFFVMTGYKFRPAASNPYFTAAGSDGEDILIGGSANVGQVKSRKGYKGRDYRDEEEAVGLIGNSEKYSCDMNWINDYEDKEELFVPAVDANDISDDNLDWIDEYEDVNVAEEVEGVNCAGSD